MLGLLAHPRSNDTSGRYTVGYTFGHSDRRRRGFSLLQPAQRFAKRMAKHGAGDVTINGERYDC